VYYIPPVHAPVSFSSQLFGPGVSDAIKTYRNAPQDRDLAALMCLFGCSEMVMTRWKRQGDIVIGLDEKGAEIVRVPMYEPVHVRPAFDQLYQIQRTNCP
jgi:nitrate reductase beta subunit